MKGSLFTETQIIAILKEAETGILVKDACQKHGISDATYYNWKAKYGGMAPSDLKRMYADMALENRPLKDLIEKKL